MLQQVCDLAVQRIPGLEHIILSSSLGLPVVRASAPGATTSPSVYETVLPTVFAMSAESLDKLAAGVAPTPDGDALVALPRASLALGQTRTAVAMYRDAVLVQHVVYPLILCLVGAPGADPDPLVAALDPLAKALEPARAAAEEAGGGA